MRCNISLKTTAKTQLQRPIVAGERLLLQEKIPRGVFWRDWRECVILPAKNELLNVEC